MGRTMFKVWQSSIVQSQKYGALVLLQIDKHVWARSMFEKMVFKSVRKQFSEFCDSPIVLYSFVWSQK